MSGKRPITSRRARKLGERERSLGLERDDEAARWLEEHDPPRAPDEPKSLGKSKALHRWRNRKS